MMSNFLLRCLPVGLLLLALSAGPARAQTFTGALQETITVTADAPLIETSNASTGGTLDREVLEALPAPGRNAFMISVTVPTVAPTGDPQFNRQQDQTQRVAHFDGWRRSCQ